jgi:hypothetical protein
MEVAAHAPSDGSVVFIYSREQSIVSLLADSMHGIQQHAALRSVVWQLQSATDHRSRIARYSAAASHKGQPPGRPTACDILSSPYGTAATNGIAHYASVSDSLSTGKVPPTTSFGSCRSIYTWIVPAPQVFHVAVSSQGLGLGCGLIGISSTQYNLRVEGVTE